MITLTIFTDSFQSPPATPQAAKPSPSKLLLFPVIALVLCASASAQTTAATSQSSLPNAPSPRAERENPVTLRQTPMAILKDQGAIWTSPARIRTKDLVWLAPLAIATGAGIATDHHVMSSVVSHDASFNNANVNASNVVVGGLLVSPAFLFGFGQLRENPHAREAGILGAEALVDGVVVEQGMKLIFWRERPATRNAEGHFFQSGVGVDSSFPSSHSVLSWATAAVIAGEYPSHWTQVGVYTLAAGVSVTRVLGQQHFPTDVLVGSAAGWLVGHYVYRARHRYSREHGH